MGEAEGLLAAKGQFHLSAIVLHVDLDPMPMLVLAPRDHCGLLTSIRSLARFLDLSEYQDRSSTLGMDGLEADDPAKAPLNGFLQQAVEAHGIM